MKTNKRFFFVTVVLLAAYVLSACGGLPQRAEQSTGDQATLKVRAMEMAYTGVIEAINGNEWTVNGQVLSVDPSVVHDGPFQVGDTVKVEAAVSSDGSITVSRVEAPTAADLAELPQIGVGNANENSNDANSNDDNSNGENSNDTNANDDNSNDDDNGNNNDNSNGDDDDSNSNGNSNDNEDDDSNSNGNDNDDDDNGSNSNGNSNDDDDDDGSNSNENSNDDDDDSSSSGGNSNDSDDDDSHDNDNDDDD